MVYPFGFILITLPSSITYYFLPEIRYVNLSSVVAAPDFTTLMQKTRADTDGPINFVCFPDIQYWDLEVEQELFRRLQRNLDRLEKKNKKEHSSEFNYLSNGVGFIKIGW